MNRRFTKPRYVDDTKNDRWIIEFVLPGERGGFFLEAGAGNGIDCSSCYVLEKEYGWKGICVEPNSSFYEQLVENRPQSSCEKVCLSNHDGVVTYIEGGTNDLSPYMGGIKEHLELYKHGGELLAKKGVEIEKIVTTLVALLKKHNAPKVIDYAAFDIEGSEFKVLEAFPFDEYKFLAISLECDDRFWGPIANFLKAHQYRSVRNPFIRKMPWERYFIHSDLVAKAPLFWTWQCFLASIAIFYRTRLLLPYQGLSYGIKTQGFTQAIKARMYHLFKTILSRQEFH